MYGKVGWTASSRMRDHTQNDRRMEFAVAPDRAQLEIAAAKSISSGTISDVLNLLEPE